MAKKTTPCLHPPARLYAWQAIDLSTKTGFIFCVACCACGQVLQGEAK